MFFSEEDAGFMRLREFCNYLGKIYKKGSTMKKESYEQAEIEIIRLDQVDVLTTSPDPTIETQEKEV